MKEIVIDARMLFTSGIGTYIRNLLLNFNNAPFKIKLIVRSEDIAKEPKLALFDLIKCDDPIYSIKEQFDLPRLIGKCDLFWSPHYNVPILPIRAKKKVVTIHDVYHLAFFSKLKIKEKIYAKIVLNKAATSDKIITVSNFSKQEILKYLPRAKDKVSVIYNGVDTSLFSAKGENVNPDLHTKYNLPKRFFLFVGNVKPHKNLKGIIQALKLLNQKEVHLVVVGKTKGLLNSDSLADLLGNFSNKEQILFLENVTNDELSMLYNKAIALVFPSFYEGFGFPPIEAMGCKCPVIASNLASLPEICEDAVEYVDPYNVNSILEKVKKLLTDTKRRDELISLGLKQHQKFTWQKAAAEHIKIFEEIF
ncbi:MAG: glycosyltransferase family 4 protein [Chlamydiae bacterium]|nr:glycosyltransferase family 4 protein [Chlamydiota bacterium]